MKGTRLTRAAALRLGKALVRHAINEGSYAKGYVALRNAQAGTGRFDPATDALGAKFGSLLVAMACEQRRYRVDGTPSLWAGEASSRNITDESLRARAEAAGQKKWGPNFALPPIPAQAQQPAPTQPPAPSAMDRESFQAAVDKRLAELKALRENARAKAAAKAQAQAQAQPGHGLGLVPSAESGRGEHYAADDVRRLEEARKLDKPRMIGGAQRLRRVLSAVVASRREPDQQTGRFINRAALGRTGAGLALRPFEKLARAHATGTALALALDCSGSMGSSDDGGDPARREEDRPRAITGYYYSAECSNSPARATREAALAISQACARSIPLAVFQFDDSATMLAGFNAPQAKRERALLEHYGPLGRTNAGEGALAAVRALATRKEPRRVAIMLCDGWLTNAHDAAADTEWRTVDALCKREGIEFHLLAASLESQRPKAAGQIDALKRAFPHAMAHARIIDARGETVSTELLREVESTLRQEMQRAN